MTASPEALALVKEALEQHGAEVITAASVPEAIGALRSRPFDILISDLAMPVEDGFSLARKLTTLPGRGRIPAVALSACGSDSDRDRALEAGFEMHIPKPLDARRLAAVVSRLVRRTPTLPLPPVTLMQSP